MCKPLFIFLRYGFGDNFLYDPKKMKARLTQLGLQIFQLLCFIGLSKESESVSALRLVFFLSFFLWVISFYRATYSQPVSIPRYDIHNLPFDQICEKCNNWKPERAVHGDTCKKGVLKLDTHYFAITNGAGYHNEKFFFLFLFYSVILGFIYIDVSLRFSFMTDLPKKTFIIWRITYWICNLIMYPYFLLNSALFLIKFLGIYSNLTMTERTTDIKFNGPGGPQNLEEVEDNFDKVRNVYERLWMNNLTDVLGQSVWKWLLPISGHMEGEGFFFPKIPEVEINDIKNTFRNSNIGTIQEIESEASEKDLENYFDNTVFKYKGKTMVIKGERNLIPFEGPDVPEEHMPSEFDSD